MKKGIIKQLFTSGIGLIVILSIGAIIYLKMVGVEFIFTKLIFTEPLTLKEFDELRRSHTLSIDSFQWILPDNLKWEKTTSLVEIGSLPRQARITNFVIIGWVSSKLKEKPNVDACLVSLLRHPYD